ncbi:MAG TPA: ArsC family reductase [Burkholderiaceae bacterium]|jgi:arsenate reductase|nr:ArsC family reductase [Burkholderiaceae bacterium]
MALTLYGIPNCDQVKKARTWLDDHDHPYHFHDFKKAGITAALIAGWLQQISWEVLINRKGTTWRALPDERKAAIVDAESATALMVESPSIIKRPVLVSDNTVNVGFSDEMYQQFFLK